MEMKFAQCVNKGMQRDYAMNTASQEFAYENKNIRITTSGNESFLAVTNEKSTLELEIYINGEKHPGIPGVVLNTNTIGDYIVLFVKGDKDYIYRGTLEDKILNLEVVFSGNINFDTEFPIESTTFYESKDVQKIYWVDGKNQPRMINIANIGQTEFNTHIDFIPNIKLSEETPDINVSIEKLNTGSGIFPSGVIQYYITYYNKFGQESNAVYVSPLYYISPLDKGGSADETQSCSFKIHIENVNTTFDYIKVYSLIRTTKDGEPTAQVVAELNIKKEGVNDSDYYEIIDTNTHTTPVAATDILFLGGNAVIASTIEQKDNTLFLGNLKTSPIDIKEEWDAIKEYFNKYSSAVSRFVKFVYKIVPVNDDKSALYEYNPSMNNNAFSTHYKLREKYRVGLQFQNNAGEWTSTLYLGDVINSTHYPHYESQNFENEEVKIVKNDDGTITDNKKNIYLFDPNSDVQFTDSLYLPTLIFDYEELGLIDNEEDEFGNKIPTIKDYFKEIKNKGYTKYRLVTAERGLNDRSIICQGYANPLSFRLNRRFTGDCYAQPSWTIRPIDKYKHLENVNKCELKDGKYQYSKYSEIRGNINIGEDDNYIENCFTEVQASASSWWIDSIHLQHVLTLKHPAENFSYNSGAVQRVDIAYAIFIKNNQDEIYGLSFWKDAIGGRYRDGLKRAINLEYQETFASITWKEVWQTIKNKIKEIDPDFEEIDTERGFEDYFMVKLDDQIFSDAFKLEYENVVKIANSLPFEPYQTRYWLPVQIITVGNLGNRENYLVQNYKDEFFIDASAFSLYTPDIFEIENIINNSNLKCRIVGKADINTVINDYNVTTSDLQTAVLDNKYSELLSFKFSKKNSNELIDIKNIPIIWSNIDSKIYNTMLWDMRGSLVADAKDNPKTGYAELKTKKIGNFWYCAKTDYEFHWRFKSNVHLGNTPEGGSDQLRYYPSKVVFNGKPVDNYIDYLKECSSISNLLQYYSIEGVEYEDGYSATDVWGYYHNLINCDLDVRFSKTFDSTLYKDSNLYLKNIEDTLFYKNAAWRRTEGSVYPETGLTFIENNYENSPIKGNAVNVPMKYNSSKHILVGLNKYGNTITQLPGYTNKDLKGDVVELYDLSTSKTTQILDSYVRISPGSSNIQIPENSKNVLIVKEVGLGGTYTVNDRSSYIILPDIIEENPQDTIKYLYKLCTIEQTPEDEANGVCKLIIQDYNFNTYKFEDSYGADHDLYTVNYLAAFDSNYDEQLEYKGLIQNALVRIKGLHEDYKFDLHSTLRGNEVWMLTESGYEKTKPLEVSSEGFYPNKDFKHYLPFNLKGTDIIDKPVSHSFEAPADTTIEGNGINNSIWVCELYKDFDDFEQYGGNSENAIEKNVFIPASNSTTIGNDIYGIYGDTYYKRWDNLRTYPMSDDDVNQVVDVVSIMLESNINLDADTRDARKRTDIYNIRPDNIENLINDVYSQSNNYTTSFVLDEKFEDTYKNTQFWWSLTKIPNSELDSWTRLNLTNVMDLNGDRGTLNKIKNWNNKLIAFQDKGIALINFNAQTVIGGQEGIPVFISNSGKVQGYYYISTTNGCKNKWSIVDSPSGLYFIDSYNKDINVLNEGITSLSQLNLFQDWIIDHEKGFIWNPNRSNTAFKSFYDPIHKEVYFVNGDYCLCYNELLKQFVSFYDYEKMNHLNILNNSILSIPVGDTSKVYKMFEGNDYCNLFGKQCEYYIQYKINNEPFIDKTWTNLEYRADIFERGNIQTNEYNTNNIITNKTFDTLNIWNEYQHGILDLNKIRFNYLKDAKNKFRIWRTNLPRAEKTETNKYGLDRIRNPWIMLELKKNALDSSERMEFRDLIIKYVI